MFFEKGKLGIRIWLTMLLIGLGENTVTLGSCIPIRIKFTVFNIKCKASGTTMLLWFINIYYAPKINIFKILTKNTTVKLGYNELGC